MATMDLGKCLFVSTFFEKNILSKNGHVILQKHILKKYIVIIFKRLSGSVGKIHTPTLHNLYLTYNRVFGKDF